MALNYVIDTIVVSRSGAKCQKCGRKIAYKSKAKYVKQGFSRKFYHPACYKRLKKK